MKQILLGLAVVSLTACGQLPPDATPVALTSSQSVSPGQHYTLVATTNSGGVAAVSVPTQIAFPLAIQGLANASGHRRAVLQIAATFCAYVADGTSAYIRQDGTCNTFTPNAPVSVNAGDAITLSIESVDSNAFTSVQADLQAGIYN